MGPFSLQAVLAPNTKRVIVCRPNAGEGEWDAEQVGFEEQFQQGVPLPVLALRTAGVRLVAVFGGSVCCCCSQADTFVDFWIPVQGVTKQADSPYNVPRCCCSLGLVSEGF